MSAELRYTDRDVRENQAHFYRVVQDYLESYKGEFSYLIDCKMRLAQNMDLTVGMIRGVLNCMRVDPRAPRLPEPQVWPDDVVPEPEPTRLKMVCTQTDFHPPHSEKNMYRCQGIRRAEYQYRLPAQVHDEKLQFCTAKSASSYLVHRVTYLEVEWYPNQYGYGWVRPPELIIHTNCKHPYTLRNGLLITRDDVTQYEEEFGLEYCSRCIYEGTVFSYEADTPDVC